MSMAFSASTIRARPMAASKRAFALRCRLFWPAPISSSASNAGPPKWLPAACTRSTTSTSRRGFRSSFGAPRPTTSSCAWPGPVIFPTLRSWTGRRGACWRIRAPKRSPSASPAQWLRLQDLEDIPSRRPPIPYFDQTLADAMVQETELFFSHLVAQDRSVLELLTADYTFVNERLARHYGITGVVGPSFKRVSYPTSHRRGLLGQGSVLTLTSHPDRTSPVLRGKWVLEVLLGAPPPPPPPDIPAFEETAAAEEGASLRCASGWSSTLRTPACASCHNVIDPHRAVRSRTST